VPFNTKALLLDVNGKPIPQYFNPTTDDFEAITGAGGSVDNSLTGSNVTVVDSGTGITITAGSTYFGPLVDVQDYKFVSIGIVSHGAYTYGALFNFNSETATDSLYWTAVGLATTNTGDRISTPVQIPAGRMQVVISNGDTASHSPDYKVFAMQR